MKNLILAIMLMTSNQVYAETSATIAVASNYIWRGLSFSAGSSDAKTSQGQAVVQGSFDFSHPSGWGLSLFTGASDSTALPGTKVERDNEFDPTVSYTYSLSDDFKIIAAVTQYVYVKNNSNNSTDFQLSCAWSNFRLDASYMQNYFGLKSSDTYARLTLRQPLQEKLGLILAVGNTSFGKEVEIGFKSYMDYKAGLFFSTGPAVVEAAFTDTNRKDLSDVDSQDDAATISIATTFQ